MKFKIKDPIFGSAITVYWGDDSFFDDIGESRWDYSSSGGLMANNGYRWEAKMWLLRDVDKVETIKILSHELMHFVLFVGDDIGLKRSEDSEEFYTYLHDYFIGKILKKMKLF